MAPLQPFPGAPFIQVEIAFPDNWNALAPTYTDVTSRLRLSDGVTFSRGRNDEYGTVSPGQFTFTLNNRDRELDPTNTASTYYPYVDEARPCRITCYWPTTATSYVEYVGLVEDWDPQWTPDGDAVVKVTGVEALGSLALCRMVASAFISKTAVGRLTDLCAFAGIPASRQAFTPGSFKLLTQTYTNTDVLAGCQEVANGQGQVFYTTRDGIFKTAGLFASTAGPGGTFGDLDPATGGPRNPGEIPYVDLGVGLGGGYRYTQVQVTPAAPTGGTAPPTATKNVSAAYISRYGTRPYARNIAATTAGVAQTVANSIAASLAAQPLSRIKRILIRPMANPSVAWPVVLATDFGNGFTFKNTPPGGGARFSLNGKVRSIQHDVKANDWTVVWNLSP